MPWGQRGPSAEPSEGCAPAHQQLRTPPASKPRHLLFQSGPRGANCKATRAGHTDGKGSGLVTEMLPVPLGMRVTVLQGFFCSGLTHFKPLGHSQALSAATRVLTRVPASVPVCSSGSAGKSSQPFVPSAQFSESLRKRTQLCHQNCSNSD